jgi:hypothetical protein
MLAADLLHVRNVIFETLDSLSDKDGVIQADALTATNEIMPKLTEYFLGRESN